MEKYRSVDREIKRLEETTVAPNPETLVRLSKLGIQELRNPTTLGGLLRRPEVTHDSLLKAFDGEEVPQLIAEQVEIRGISGLSHEVVQKLEEIRPITLGQAERISGVTPSAISLIMILLEKFQSRLSTDCKGQ